MSSLSEAVARLSAHIVTTAGGYLRNTLAVPNQTCAVCRTAVDSGYSHCFACNQHLQSPNFRATRLGFVTYAVQGRQSGYLMRNYKNGVHGQHETVRILTALAISQHWYCAQGQAPFTHWATVPSLPARAGPHPLNQIVAGLIKSIPEAVLVPAASTTDPRAFRADHYSLAHPIPGAHVLLVDDTWAQGGHLQSAAHALRAGASAEVSALLIARWMNLSFGPTDAFMKTVTSVFDPSICPWTAGLCP